jgi:hypothetical protein
LLVIEEAHRLLKNTSTESVSEDMGNPKGKAVEHFTNMIAEMRSYGQGVIVAEQIPSKLAPDVIKNSSNKIVQRLVAIDDQNIMANTIGIDSDDAMQLGALSTGKSLCHKEGMSKPVKVDIIPTSDIKVTDEMLYTGEAENRVKRINISILREAVGNSKEELTVKVLNSLLMNLLSIKNKNLVIKKDEPISNYNDINFWKTNDTISEEIKNKVNSNIEKSNNSDDETMDDEDELLNIAMQLEKTEKEKKTPKNNNISTNQKVNKVLKIDTSNPSNNENLNNNEIKTNTEENKDNNKNKNDEKVEEKEEEIKEKK